MVRNPLSGVLLDLQLTVAIREHGREQSYFAPQESVDRFDKDLHYYGHPDPDDHLTQQEHRSN